MTGVELFRELDDACESDFGLGTSGVSYVYRTEEGLANGRKEAAHIANGRPPGRRARPRRRARVRRPRVDGHRRNVAPVRRPRHAGQVRARAGRGVRAGRRQDRAPHGSQGLRDRRQACQRRRHGQRRPRGRRDRPGRRLLVSRHRRPARRQAAHTAGEGLQRQVPPAGERARGAADPRRGARRHDAHGRYDAPGGNTWRWPAWTCR